MSVLKKLEYFFAKGIKIGRGRALAGGSFHRSAKIGAGSSMKNVSFGRHSYCGYDCSFLNVNVGSFCSIASRVIAGGVAHPMHFVSTSPAFLSHKDSVTKKYSKHDYLPEHITNIGSDVWIGDCAIIKSGVNIGHGAVIGMGSVVTCDVPPYSVFAGNPAKFIRFRFDSRTVEELVDSEWWNLDDKVLLSIAQYVNDPSTFLRQLKKLHE